MSQVALSMQSLTSEVGKTDSEVRALKEQQQALSAQVRRHEDFIVETQPPREL